MTKDASGVFRTTPESRQPAFRVTVARATLTHSPNTFLPRLVSERVTDEYTAVVYDLDGTLVDLDVDWALVEREVGARLREEGVDPDNHETWEQLTAGENAGIGAQVNALISEHEIGGALRSERLPTADELGEQSVPVGVCSLNCELAVRAALEKHDLDGSVDAVVGRDSVPTRKPNPGPLLAAVEALGVDPAAVLFVGDSEKDAQTAERAGTRFRWV
jgi:phosphoglycolate phosphatase